MHRKSWWLGFPFILSVVLMLLNISYVQAGGELLSGSDPRELNLQIHKGGCYSCHVDSNLTGSFDDGDTIFLSVDSLEFQQSIHGRNNLICEDCHQETIQIPHRESSQINCPTCHIEDVATKPYDFSFLLIELPYSNRREMTLALNNNCLPCHEDEFALTADSIHGEILSAGNVFAPLCVDCHGSHDVSDPNQPRNKISKTCGSCHKAVFSTYQISVHSKALEEDSNLDVPTCVDCHGVHSVLGPRDLDFRNSSVMICGDCHSKPKIMEKYGISTDVLETYIEDFHGRTVNLFRIQQEGNPSNKAVCYDCHGIHNILPADNPQSQVYPENLQYTCGRCHEDANITFPEAWLSHFSPDLESTPALYYVNTIYPLLIAGTLGGMGLYIILDARKRLTERWSKKKPKVTDTAEAHLGSEEHQDQNHEMDLGPEESPQV